MIEKQTSKLILLTIGLGAFVALALITIGAPKAASEFDGIQTTQKNSTLYLPTLYLPVVLNNYINLDTPVFGVQMYGNTSSSSPYHPALIATDASWLRVAIAWSSIEPATFIPSVYDWTATDGILSAARDDMGGLNLVVTITQAPDWVTGDPHGPIPAEFLDEFSNFVNALVERYDGDGIDDAPGSPVVNHWEFYNEPDNNFLQEPRSWGNDGDQYATMLQTIYPVVKAANSQAQVVMGGLAYDWFTDQGGPFVREFLTDVLDAGGGQYFDIMNFHSYPGFALRWTSSGPGLKEKTEHIQNVLNQYSLNKPIIITETGWHDNNHISNPSTPEIQARYVVELFTQGLATNVKVVIWWMLFDAKGGWPYDTGLVTHVSEFNPPNVKEPASNAYQRIVAELSAAVFERTLSTAETGHSDLEAHKFNDYGNQQQRVIYVAWLNPVDTTMTQPLLLPGSTATVRNSLTGATETITDSQDGVVDGQVTVQVGSDPVYVEIDQ